MPVTPTSARAVPRWLRFPATTRVRGRRPLPRRYRMTCLGRREVGVTGDFSRWPTPRSGFRHGAFGGVETLASNRQFIVCPSLIRRSSSTGPCRRGGRRSRGQCADRRSTATPSVSDASHDWCDDVFAESDEPVGGAGLRRLKRGRSVGVGFAGVISMTHCRVLSGLDPGPGSTVAWVATTWFGLSAFLSAAARRTVFPFTLSHHPGSLLCPLPSIKSRIGFRMKTRAVASLSPTRPVTAARTWSW